MNKKLLIEIIVVFVIAAAILALFPLSLAVWIYLVWMVWKKKTNIFHDQMEPKSAERRLKRLKTFLLVGGISHAMYWVTVLPLRVAIAVMFNQPEEGGLVVHFIAGFFVILFIIGTTGGLVIFLKGRRETR